MEAQNKSGTSAKPSTTPVSPNHDFFKKPPRSILNVEAQNSSGTSAEPSTTPVSHPSTTIVSPNHDFFKNFPPGFRFRPLDEELVVSYLMKKVKNEQLPLNRMVEVDLYNHSPDFLAETYKHFAEGGEEWYFFTPRERKYKNGSRPKRAAGNGYWKATGADKDVMYKGHVVGYKKSLVFYRGKPPSGDKTNWIMHEFRVNEPPREKSNPNDMRLNEWVLCRIYKKGETHHRIPDLKDLKEDQTDEGKHHEHEKEPNSTAVAVTNYHPSSLYLDHANLSSQRSHIGREHVYVHERFPSEMTLSPMKNMEEDGSKEGGYHQKEPDSTPAGAVTYHPNILDIEQVNLSSKRRNTERDYEFGNQPLPPEIMPLHQQIQHNNLVEEPSLCNLSSPQMLKPEDFTENLQGLLEFLSKLT